MRIRQKLPWILIIIILLSFFACGKNKANNHEQEQNGLSTSGNWQEQYDLGVRYLSEGNYQEAIIAFTAAIQIDPKRVESYLELSNAYSLSGDDESAMRVLEDGYDVTNDEKLIDAINGLKEKGTSLWLTDEMISVSDLKIGGNPINRCTINDFITAYPNAPGYDGFNVLREEDLTGVPGIKYVPYLEMVGEIAGCLSVWSVSESDLINYCSFHDAFGDYINPIEIDFKTISLGDTRQDVLTKFGFSETGIKFISNIKTVDVGYSGTKYNVYPQETESVRAIYLTDYDSNVSLSLEFDDGDRLYAIAYHARTM